MGTGSLNILVKHRAVFPTMIPVASYVFLSLLLRSAKTKLAPLGRFSPYLI